MSATYQVKLQAALTKAFIEAIRKVGLNNFKATSLFGSNNGGVDDYID